MTPCANRLNGLVLALNRDRDIALDITIDRVADLVADCFDLVADRVAEWLLEEAT